MDCGEVRRQISVAPDGLQSLSAEISELGSREEFEMTDTSPTEPGDEIVVAGRRVGESSRKGEILEVLGVPDHPHYRVRWEDSRVSIFFPATDTTVQRRRELVA
jgi:uncharacterized protein DUF1918